MDINKMTAYTCELEEKVPELGGTAWLLRHKKSGARLFLVSNEDENKVFTIGFRTPPADSTGLPHILEHSVLCGSEQFPVKDPFIELAKGSLNTFLNAITYPDKTIYPIASCNDQDFQNLTAVYMDAVLHPNIYKSDKTFRQEGWHYELEDTASKLSYNGVVYNEMKGAFSSPESVLDRLTSQVLFPDTPYAFESGGDPADIVDLSYEDFLKFHQTYYHPSNSFIYLYGNMDMEEKLEWMDREYLSHYDAVKVDSEIPEQKPFEQDVYKTAWYGISEEETEENSAYLSWNKVTGSVLDPKRYMAFQVLEYALLGAPGAPLKKALTDAEIGRDIYGGYDSSMRQTSFSVVAKGADADRLEEFLQIIRGTLEQLAEQGIRKKSLLAGINHCEFKCREADFGSYPKGLMYGIQCFDSWLYDDSAPLMHLKYEDTFRFLREQVDTGYFEGLIREYLLDNPHGGVVTLLPKKGYTAQLEAEAEKRLEDYQKSLSSQELEQLVKDTEELRAYQEEPSTEEELKTVPMLQVSDIGKKAAGFHNEEKNIVGMPVVFHRLFTGGIGYISFLFDASSVATEDLPYLSLLKTVLGQLDTEHFSYQELTDEINIATGGFGASLGIYTQAKDMNSYDLRLETGYRALFENMGKGLSLLREILFTSRLDDTKRIREIVGQLASRSQMALNNAGHTAAVVRAGSYLSESAWVMDTTSGIGYYHFLEDLLAHFEERKEELTEKLKEVAGQIFRRENVIVSYTAEAEGLSVLEQELPDLADSLPEGFQPGKKREIALERKNEGFKTASQVQYVARAGSFRSAGYDYTGAMRVLKVILNYEYLWQKLRVKGGAYGCMSGMGRSGESYLVSYRDPNLRETNEVYEGLPEYLRQVEISGRDMTRYIIGAVSDLDTPLTPNDKGRRSMGAYLTGVTEEMIQNERDQVLGCTQEDIRALSGPVAAVLASDCLCVIGNDEKIESEKEMFGSVSTLFH